MKKDKARRDRSGIGRPQNASAFKKTDAQSKPIKKSTGNQKLIEGTQYLNKKGYTPLKPGEKAAANIKGGKPTKVTPKKKAEAPAPKPKRRLYFGRGGSGGGGGFLDQLK